MSYALVRIDPFEVIASYPSDLPPDLVVWPNGDATHGATAGFERDGCRVVQVVYGPDAPGEFHDNTATEPSLDGSVLTYTRTWKVWEISAVQSALTARIDGQAEIARAKYLTPGAGQALTYQEKGAEAELCVADKSPTPDKYPMLAATVGIEGSTISDVAALVLKTRAAWLQVGSAIEARRLKAKADVMAAQDSSSAIAVFSKIVWP